MRKEDKLIVIGELKNAELSSITKEILGGARKLAEILEGSVELILLVSIPDKELARQGIEFGADLVTIFHGAGLGHYHPEAWLRVLQPYVEGSVPTAVFLGQTPIGRDLGPRLAHRLGTGIAMDCVQIDVDPESKLLHMTRPVFGGKALAVMLCRSRPQIATVRAKALNAREPDESRRGEVRMQEIEDLSDALRIRMVDKKMPERKGIPLEEATVIVSGGRGIGGKKGFQMLEELARLLNGAVGASRPPCDQGWIEASKQIGLTGKIVRPHIYFAICLSGTSQHMAGCKDSDTIIAINKDPDAEIFSYAHFGVVVDYRKVLPPLIKRLKEKITSNHPHSSEGGK